MSVIAYDFESIFLLAFECGANQFTLEGGKLKCEGAEEVVIYNGLVFSYTENTGEEDSG